MAQIFELSWAGVDVLTELRQWLVAKDESALVPMMLTAAALAVLGACLPRRRRGNAKDPRAS